MPQDRISYSTQLMQQAVSNYLNGDPQPVEVQAFTSIASPLTSRGATGPQEIAFHRAAGQAAVTSAMSKWLMSDSSVAPTLPTEDATLWRWLCEAHSATRTRLGLDV